MFGLNPWMILGFGIALLTASIGGYVKGSNDKQTAWNVARLEASKKAHEEKQKADAEADKITDELQGRVTKAEDDYHAALKRIDGLRIANGRLQRVACGLFDKNGNPIPVDQLPPGTPAAAAGTRAPAGCGIPQQVIDDLVGLAADADAVAERFALARRTALETCAKMGSDTDKAICAELLK